MKCHEARKWISPYLDSELDPTKTFEVSQHLESCSACKSRFEKEAQADQIIAASLKKEESYVDWPFIEQKILAPPRRVIRLRPRWLLAAAACIAFIILSLVDRSQPAIASPAKWAIDELHQLSPHGEPFQTEPGCTPTDIEALASEVLDCKVGLSLDGQWVRGHLIDLAEVKKRTCSAGTERVEVLLNCCKEPVLLIIGHFDERGVLADLNAAIEKGDGRYKDSQDTYNFTYHVYACKKGDYVVIAVSPHPVEHLVLGIELAANY